MQKHCNILADSIEEKNTLKRMCKTDPRQTPAPSRQIKTTAAGMIGVGTYPRILPATDLEQ